ncbi:MAG: Tad domain-containing protein [Anaerolineae bacterium]|jgi:hypothetical protein
MADRRRESEAGQALIVFLLMAVGMLVVVGLALDGGTVYLQRRRMQNAADAGALEGARHLYLWQNKAVYPNVSGEQKILEGVCTMAERNGVRDTDGIPGNHINDNVIAYYVDSVGQRLSTSDTPLGEEGAPAFFEDCYENRCRPAGLGRCCGVEVEVDTEFGTSLIRLTGPVTAPVEAAGAGVFVCSDGYGGAGNSAAWALGSGCGNEQLPMPGDGVKVVGTAHSNDGTRIPGSYDPDVDRPPTIDHLEYVNTGSEIGEETVVGSLDILPAAVDPNLPFNLAFYQAYVQNNATAHFTGDWSVPASGTYDGVYWVQGNMEINVPDVTLTGVFLVEGYFEALGDNFAIDHATIVATTGWIHIRSNNAPISPWIDDPWGLSLYSNRDHVTCGPCQWSHGHVADREFGICVSGDHGVTPGVFYAPRSRVCINADENNVAGGGIFADSIDVRGDGWILLPWRPEGGGVGELERITLVE